MGLCSSSPVRPGVPESVNGIDGSLLTPEFASKYKCTKKEPLGQGSFATVWQVEDVKDKKEWAVKVIDKSKCSKEELKDILWEAEALKIVQHDYVTEMKEFIDGDHFIYIVMEIMRGGELFDRIVERGFYSEAMARDAVRTMCIGLDHCHKNGVIHLDMKPENVLYADTSEESALKLCDFGIAKRCPPDGFLLGDGQLHGTPGYISPEMIRKEKYDGKTDVWAIGVITYILLGGVPPFDEPPDLVDTPEGQLELFKQILSGEFFPFEENVMEGEPNPWDSVSKDAKAFIKSLLTVDPRKRPSFDELLKNNKWLTSDMSEDQRAHLAGTTEKIKKYQARKRLKGAIRKVITVNRIKRLTAPAQVSINETADKAVIAVTPREEEE